MIGAVMYYVLYGSTAVKPFDEAELEEMLRSFRQKNEAVNISGMLLYFEGSILQYFEGSKSDVTALFQKIDADTRHHGIVVLDQNAIDERALPKWSMGYESLGPVDVARLGHIDFTKDAIEQALDTEMPKNVLSMMRTFYRTTRGFN